MQRLFKENLLSALALAKLRRGFCSPNPAVGAVIVDHENNIVAQGFHHKAGFPHAEIEAIKQFAGNPHQATLYVTLEPCCHFGKTPPCTDAIIQSGLKHVVYGFVDPNPMVAGEGEKRLIEAGVKCEYIPTTEINQFYQSYLFWHKTKKPFVTAKLAMTLNGKIAGEAGKPIAITGEEAKALTHQSRLLSDAILTSAKTILNDNPQLNVRIDDKTIYKPLYIVDRNLMLYDAYSSLKIFLTKEPVTLFHSSSCDPAKIKKFIDLGVNCISVDENKDGLDSVQMMSHIGASGVHDLWVESGGKLISTLIQAKQVQRLLLYIAPSWLSAGYSAFDDDFSIHFANHEISWSQAGKDTIGEINFFDE